MTCRTANGKLPVVAYFVSANSSKGFVTHHDAWLNGWDTAYLIKGGPGGGKSTFMRRIQSRMEAHGFPCEAVRCATDPDSLDGLAIPALNTAFFDATPPHAAEPRYFGAKDHYLPLGGYCDVAHLSGRREEITKLTDSYRLFFPRITSCLSGAKALSDQRFDIVLRGIQLDRLTGLAAEIIRQEGLAQNSKVPGRTHARFLSARDRSGVRTIWETVHALCPRRYIIEDAYGLSPFLLAPVLRAAVNAGQDVWASYDPQSPDSLLRHILLPNLGLGFISYTGLSPVAGDVMLSIDAMIDPGLIHAKRVRLALLAHAEASRLQDASRLIMEARALHDELEAVYRPYMDFDGLTAAADMMAERMLDVAL